MIETRKTPESGKTPATITVSMIDQDLKDGSSKPEMAIKYGIKPWEVDEMFKHPFLKGRRPSRKKALSFSFVDDITEDRIKETGTVIEQAAEVEEATVDPNQMTLEQAIDDAIESVEDAKQEMQKAEEAIVDMLSPTEYTEKENFVEELETLANEADDEWVEEERPMQVNNLDSDALDTEEEIELDEDDTSFEL